MNKIKKTKKVMDEKKKKYIYIGVIIILVMLILLVWLYWFLSNKEIEVKAQSNINSNETIESVLEDKTFDEQKNILLEILDEEINNYNNICLDNDNEECITEEEKEEILANLESLKEKVNLLENAEEVTVLLATIREMDTHKDMKQAIETGNTYFAENMRRYSKKFLLEDKYRLVPFDGIKKNNYHDDIIIQYLLITPVKDRPTILTADANLADKAKCHGLEYILYNPKNFILKISFEIIYFSSKIVDFTIASKHRDNNINTRTNERTYDIAFFILSFPFIFIILLIY